MINAYDPTPGRAMQTRCPHCLGEQYFANVLSFSVGDTGCTVCRQLSKPMTYPEWFKALGERRRQIQADRAA